MKQSIVFVMTGTIKVLVIALLTLHWWARFVVE